MTPRDPGPNRTGQKGQRAEDDALVDRRVALQIRAWRSLPEVQERLAGAPGEARVRRERERHVDVEDLLREALVGVDRRVEEDEHQRRPHEQDGRARERGQRQMTEPGEHETAAMIAEPRRAAARLGAWLTWA